MLKRWLRRIPYSTKTVELVTIGPATLIVRLKLGWWSRLFCRIRRTLALMLLVSLTFGSAVFVGGYYAGWWFGASSLSGEEFPRVIETSFANQSLLYGDQLVASTTIVFDVKTVDAKTVELLEPKVQPFTVVAKHRDFDQRGRVGIARFRVVLDCVSVPECLPRGQTKQFVFPPAEVLYEYKKGHVTRSFTFQWPPLNVASRITEQDLNDFPGSLRAVPFKPPTISSGRLLPLATLSWVAFAIGVALSAGTAALLLAPKRKQRVDVTIVTETQTLAEEIAFFEEALERQENKKLTPQILHRFADRLRAEYGAADTTRELEGSIRDLKELAWASPMIDTEKLREILVQTRQFISQTSND